jgi:hypothetical protein
MIFPARNFHLFGGFSMAMLVIITDFHVSPKLAREIPSDIPRGSDVPMINEDIMIDPVALW